MKIKYLTSGQAVNVISELPEGHLVKDIFESEEGQYCGETRFEDETLHAKPPVQVWEKRVVELEQKITELNEEKAKLFKSVEETKKALLPVFEKSKRYAQLARLEDFLDGKITHYVQYSGYGSIDIIPFKDAVYEESRHTGHLKLLTLFGESGGDLQWKISCYHDGSGGQTNVWPATSLEEANQIAMKLISDAMETTKDKPRHDILKEAQRLGVTVPVAYELPIVGEIATNQQRIYDEHQKHSAGYLEIIANAKQRLEQLNPQPQ